ncbi:hypothetical protein LXA43DRAFT_1051750, partial [Ganoderma leucocontextum]
MKPTNVIPVSTTLAAMSRTSRKPPARRRIIGLSRKLGFFFLSLLVLAVASGPSALDAAGILDTNFYARAENDRFVSGNSWTDSSRCQKATVWTGGDSALEVLHADILLDRGLIRQIGQVDLGSLAEGSVYHVDAKGKWGEHSTGVYSMPSLSGSSDTNSRKGPILPWLPALDALNTYDDAYKLGVSGGAVTTSLVLPGSANAIGGQAAIIKLRPTEERSPPLPMLLENMYEQNTTLYDPKVSFRSRQMKHACGKNTDRVYSGTRMDTALAFRQAYDKARQIKEAQDEYCTKDSRGRVKVHTHCYETVDLDNLVRFLTNLALHI